MLVVACPDHELVEPGAAARHGLAEPLLDPLVHEYAVEMGHLRGQPQQGDVLLAEHAVVDAAVVGFDQRAQPRVLALRDLQTRTGLAFEPDVGIEASLMAGMAGGGGPAARLTDVADVEMGLARGAYLLREGRDEVDGDGLTPIAIAADADRLVARRFERKGLG